MSIQNYINFIRIKKLLDKIAATSHYLFPQDPEEQILYDRVRELLSLRNDIECATKRNVSKAGF